MTHRPGNDPRTKLWPFCKTPSSLAVVNDYFFGEFGVLSVWPRGFRLGSFLNPKPKNPNPYPQRTHIFRAFGPKDPIISGLSAIVQGSGRFRDKRLRRRGPGPERGLARFFKGPG